MFKITVKTLKNEFIPLDIHQIKEKLKELKGFEIDLQKLVLRGKQTANDETLAKLNVKEGDVFIIMILQKKTEKVDSIKPIAPVDVNSTPVNPIPIQPTNPTTTDVKPLPTPTTTTNNPSSSQFVTQENVQNLMSMGFERAKCEAALKAAYGNSQHAVNFLLSGNIPESHGGDQPGEQEMIAALGNHPMFQQIKLIVQQNPDALPQILQQIAANSPQIFELITKNPQAFERMLNTPVSAAPSNPPPGSIVVSPVQEEAINRLMTFGFSKIDAAQAYFACDKNQQLAANYLFDRQAKGDFDDQSADQINEPSAEEDDDNLYG